VAKEDIVASFRRRRHPAASPTGASAGTADESATPAQEHDEVSGSRWYIFGFGLLTIGMACVISDVIAALTIAYDILVGGLLVAILGGLIWKRGTITGALASIGAGVVVTLGTMAYYGDIYANEPIFAGLIVSLLAYVVVSLVTPATPEPIRAEWDRRVNRKRTAATSPAATQQA
jgi:SSS family solute:Na+ symporter